MINPFKKGKKSVDTYPVIGMHCASCAAMIESELDDAGIKASCSYAKQTIEVNNEKPVNPQKLKKIVQKAGYDIELH